jgi:hypothetical protein
MIREQHPGINLEWSLNAKLPDRLSQQTPNGCIAQDGQSITRNEGKKESRPVTGAAIIGHCAGTPLPFKLSEQL